MEPKKPETNYDKMMSHRRSCSSPPWERMMRESHKITVDTIKCLDCGKSILPTERMHRTLADGSKRWMCWACWADYTDKEEDN